MKTEMQKNAQQIAFTKMTLVDPKFGGKTFSLDQGGSLVKETIPWVNEAIVQVQVIDGLPEFSKVLSGLERGREVLLYGVPTMAVPETGLRVLSERLYEADGDKSTAIMRSERHFKWPTGPGIILGDYDPPAGEGSALSGDEILSRLGAVCPVLGEAQTLWWPSSSSCIFHDFLGAELSGLKGQRFYWIAKDASDIPRAMEVMRKRLWLADEGHILVSKSGQRLVRTLLDCAVWQASRLDYASGPVLEIPLEQRRGEPVLLNPESIPLVDTRAAFPDLTLQDEQQYQAKITAAKEAASEEADQVRVAWVEARLVDEAHEALGVDATKEVTISHIDRVREKRTRELTKLANGERTVLDACHVIYLPGGNKVTVRDILLDPKAYDEVKTPDFIEPNYDGGRKTGILYPHNRRAVSQAHGANAVYILGTDKQAREIFVERMEPLRRLWTDHVIVQEMADKAELLSLSAIDAFIALDDNSEAQARILERVRSKRVKGQHGKLVKSRRRVLFNAEPVQVRRVDDSRQEFDVTDPNQCLEQTFEIEGIAAKRHLAFSFGSNAIVVKKYRSKTVRVVQRDEAGNKLPKADDQEGTKAYHTVRAKVVGPGEALTLAAQCGVFYVWTASREGIPMQKPVEIPGQIRTMLAANMGGELPVLNGIALHPVWWNGELLTGNGVFHEESGLWLQTGDVEPTEMSDPKEALAFLLDEWLCDFPFATELDALRALTIPASMLTAKTHYVEEAGPPINMISAPHAGTGKSLLACVLGQAITGRVTPSATYSDNEEERGKLITSAIMEGHGMLLFDNIRSGSSMGSSHKCLIKLATDGDWVGRILGESKTFVGPAGIVVVLTGNNISPTGPEMPSRTQEIRLVVKEGVNLATRDFKHRNLIQWTMDNRGKILGAFKAILSVKGQRNLPGRFPGWTDIVASPLIEVSGVDGFFDSWIEAAEEENAGTGLDHMTALVTGMAGAEWKGKKQPKDGVWLTASEWLECVDTHLWQKVAFSQENIGEKTAHRLLRSCLDILIEENFSVRMMRANLGARTGHKVLKVYKVQRRRDEAPKTLKEIAESSPKVVPLRERRDD